MKILITLFFVSFASAASAQWSNTTNQFFDSLHMPVCTAAGQQTNPIVLNSFPDGGYFVIWEDERNDATTLTDIYAQKYDAAGNRLWAPDGVPVANGNNHQRYSSQRTYDDYRMRSYAATDSAGGFYICYIDDSIANFGTRYPRIAVQHMQSSGTARFPGAGFIMAAAVNSSVTYSKPQLIADGIGGFYLSYVTDDKNLYIFDYKDVGGTLTYYGSALLNKNGVEVADSFVVCYPKHHVDILEYPLSDYNIWSDGERGCNAVFSLVDGTLGYNRFWRAKKNARVTYNYYQSDGVVNLYGQKFYEKDSVYLLYQFKVDHISKICSGNGGSVVVVETEFLRSNGFQLMDDEGYNYSFLKGVTVFTPGNMNVDLMACAKRILKNNAYSEDAVVGYSIRTNKLDSVPFQHASYTDPNFSYNTMPPPTLDKVNLFRDTLLTAPEAGHNVNFSLSAGGKEIFATAVMGKLQGTQNELVQLQHLSVERITADSFAIQYKTPKAGQTIGQENLNGIPQSQIVYWFPSVAVNTAGSSLFCITEPDHFIQVSPIGTGADLTWGAMGKPLGSGAYPVDFSNNYFIEPYVVTLHPTDGTGVIAWKDNRSTGNTSAGNIFMRHIDQLNTPQYVPAIKAVKLLPNPFGALTTIPATLAGTSKRYTVVEINNPSGDVSNVSTVAEILDNYNLGRVLGQVFQNSSNIRNYNNKAYLDRNYTITPENNPATGKPASVNLRLYFTGAEYDALKSAHFTPGDAIPPNPIIPSDQVYIDVISQPNNTNDAPTVYTPVAGEKVIRPLGMKAVAGGYYVEIVTNGFSNFFVEWNSNPELCRGGNGTITSNIVDASYQWQVNTGSGFTNISDGSNYSGTDTHQLALTNPPGSWYGYQYRCVTPGGISEVTTLRFTNTWKGTVDNNWETAGNWSCGVVPDANTDVYIPVGTVLVNSDRSCRSLTINPEATVTVTPGKNLTVMH